jgi:addiction module RelE/StbE family toxin
VTATIRWTRRALRRLDEIGVYIAKDNPRAAQQTVTKIFATIMAITDHPERGRPGRVKGTRELVIPGTLYIAPYRINGSHIEILTILHSAQNWPKRF